MENSLNQVNEMLMHCKNGLLQFHPENGLQKCTSDYRCCANFAVADFVVTVDHGPSQVKLTGTNSTVLKSKITIERKEGCWVGLKSCVREGLME
ncbi:hypothetical protein L1987_11300 [Smallanthus sonchifolius]|uniref:Uncharacterized protein n=1 Tax=Smallanthus sonchifolius TaxID=185202 RepID=A0ACB9JAK9_9ASTR|nr:hypothetical protein L1987_11300 [Smallanthus sonchifolius]